MCNKNKFNRPLFNLSCTTLLFLLAASFYTSNLFSFYLLFEASLIPIFFLILGWGYQPERLQAGTYIILYTVFASFPLLISILAIKNLRGSIIFPLLSADIPQPINLVIFITFRLTFLIKLPFYSVHLWLPKAHTEAPLAGSMVLAGLLLKLGGYGLYRTFDLFKQKIFFFSSLGLYSLWGGVVVRIICLRQTDIKAFIALSSVAHIALVLSALCNLTNRGIKGALLVILGHGLGSPLIFYLANLNYLKSSRRSIFLNKGLITLAPLLALCWFLGSASNIRAPPSLTLIGELIIISSLSSWSPTTTLLTFSIVLFAGVYSLYLYKTSQHGKTPTLTPTPPLSALQFLITSNHWLPLNARILFIPIWI